MDDISSRLLSENVVLLGESPTDPNKNWVVFDVERGDTAKFRILEVRETADWKYGEFSSSNKALETLRNYIEAHPWYRDYVFREYTKGEKAADRSNRKTPAETEPDKPFFGSADSKAEPNNAERPNYTEPSKENPSGESPDQNIFEKIEGGIQEAFRPGHESVQLLKQQLENDTDESNWIANAAIATGLDVLDFAMGMVEGIPLGILDTRNIGEGIAEGTWEGAKRDISRALNVLPQGKILKAVDRALTAGDVVETLSKGDLKESGIAVGMAVLSVSSKGTKGKKKFTKKSNKKSKAPKDTAPDFDYYEGMPRTRYFQNHHIALKAIFERARDPRIQEIFYQLRAVPLSKQTHETLHKIVNDALRRKGLMPGSRVSGTKAEFSNKDVKKALDTLVETYREQGIEDLEDLAQHLEGLRNAMHDAGLF